MAIMALGLLPTAAMAQFSSGLVPRGLGESALERGEDMLEQAPDQLDEFLQNAKSGTVFETPEECLGTLQLAVNAAAVAANILPFSSVHTFEDERGPVALVRLMLNGDKVHFEAFCDGVTLSAIERPWGDGSPDPVPKSGSSLDAMLGMLLLGRMQGIIGADETQAGPEGAGAVALNSGPVEAPRDVEPVTTAEKDAFRLALQACWSVPEGVREAGDLRIVVAVEFNPDGGIVADSIRLIDPAELPDPRYEAAFRAARIALLRCAPYFDMPREKYELWRHSEIVFNPDGLVSW